MKRLLAFFLFLCLLAGCGPQLGKYPRVEQTSRGITPQTLTIDVPRDADQTTLDAISQFAAALLDLSHGAITLDVFLSGNPAGAVKHGVTHLAVLSNSDLIQVDPSMAFLDWPFYVRDADQWLTVMGAEDGAVRGSVSLREALGGEIIGLWYRDRMVLLCRGTFYEEIGFAGSTLGVLGNREETGLFESLGEELEPQHLYIGTREELLELLEAREIKYMEYPLGKLDPEGLPEMMKYLEDTAHRVEGNWLVLGKDALDEETARIVRAAAASVPQWAWDTRLREEEALFQALEESGVTVRQRDYDSLYRAAQEYFRRNRWETD